MTIYKHDDIYKSTLEYFKGDELATNAWINKYCLKDSDDNYYELNPNDMHNRIAKELARIESNYVNGLKESEIFDLLKDFKYIVPQGSPMSGIGNNLQIVSLSNCVDGESLVYTKELGLIKMRDIKIGMNVLTHKNRFRKVLKHWSNGLKETYAISRTFGDKRPLVRDAQEMSRFLCATPEHKVLTEENEWIEIKDLVNKQNRRLKQPKIDDLSEYPTVFPIGMGKHIIFDEEFAWIIGMYLAEGGIKKNDSSHPSVYFTLNIDEKDHAERISNFCLQNLGHEAWIQTWENMNFIQVNVFEPEFANLLKSICGHKFDKKRLPEWIFSVKDSIKRAIIDGFLSGDGTNYEDFDDNYNFFSIANPTLAYEIGLLSRALGKNVRFNFLTKGKLIKNRTISTTISNSIDKIKMVKSPIFVEVFDMEVEDDHSFVAGDIICHNCFVVGSEADSYGGIFLVDQEQAQLMKRRGGVGHDLSHIRPKNAKVNNSALISTGINPFMQRFSNTTREVAQDGRRGALMLSMDIEHPNSEDFIDAKLDTNQITGANISVKIRDEFMKAVLDKTEYTQKFPIGSDNPMVEKKIDASKLWNKIIHNAWKSAEPGVLFWDTIIRESVPDCYADLGYKTVSTNPCQPSWATVLTPEGIRTFKDIKIRSRIWSSEGWTTVVNKQSSGIQEVYSYETPRGKFIGTKEHKIIQSGEKIEVKDAKSIDTLKYNENTTVKIHNQDVMDGLVIGDGSVHKASNNLIFLCIGSNDQDYFDSEISDKIIKHRDKLKSTAYTVETTINSNELPLLPIREIPERFFHGDKDKVCGFLRGLYSANGSVVDKRITLKTSCSKLRDQVQIMLSSIGISSYYTTNKSKKTLFNNGEYECKESYDINISSDRKKFYDLIGFIQKYKTEKLKNILNVKNSGKKVIANIVSFNKVSDEEVFDITVDNKSHTYWTGGLNVSNCGEIPLCPYDSCRLLCLNLYSYVDNPFTKNSKFNFDLFKRHVFYAQKFMDDIIDLENEKIDQILAKIEVDPEEEDVKIIEKRLWLKIKDKTINGRRTGLGITAEGDMLAALNLTYGTSNASDFSEEVHRVLAIEAYKASCQLAQERGSFPIYDYNREINNPFIKRLVSHSPELNEMLKKGRRNIAILTTAPTGTVSLMTQTTSGIEPAFLISYKRRKKINPSDKNNRVDFIDEQGDKWEEYHVFHHKFLEWLRVNNYNIEEVKLMSDAEIQKIIEISPYYKATSNDVDWLEKVRLQGRIQKYVDHSISVTINLPENVTEELVSKVYEEGWRTGCKGMTVYRDNSRSGVLVSKSKDDSIIPENNVPKRPKQLECDVLRFTNKGEKWIGFIGLNKSMPYEIFTGLAESFVIPNWVEKGMIRKEKVKNKENELFSRYDFVYFDKEGYEVIMTGLNRAFEREYWNIGKMTSALLRHHIHLPSVIRIIESLKLDGDVMGTWKKGMIRMLKKYIKDEVEKSGDICKSCGSHNVVYKEGCLNCLDCGWSKC